MTWSLEKDFISAIYYLNWDLFITESGDVKKDIGHILDFITRVKCLKVGVHLPLNSFTVYWPRYFCSWMYLITHCQSIIIPYLMIDNAMKTCCKHNLGLNIIFGVWPIKLRVNLFNGTFYCLVYQKKGRINKNE